MTQPLRKRPQSSSRTRANSGKIRAEATRERAGSAAPQAGVPAALAVPYRAHAPRGHTRPGTKPGLRLTSLRQRRPVSRVGGTARQPQRGDGPGRSAQRGRQPAPDAGLRPAAGGLPHPAGDRGPQPRPRGRTCGRTCPAKPGNKSRSRPPGLRGHRGFQGGT